MTCTCLQVACCVSSILQTASHYDPKATAPVRGLLEEPLKNHSWRLHCEAASGCPVYSQTWQTRFLICLVDLDATSEAC